MAVVAAGFVASVMAVVVAGAAAGATVVLVEAVDDPHAARVIAPVARRERRMGVRVMWSTVGTKRQDVSRFAHLFSGS
jgi:hypothetical protein